MELVEHLERVEKALTETELSGLQRRFIDLLLTAVEELIQVETLDKCVGVLHRLSNSLQVEILQNRPRRRTPTPDANPVG